MTGSPRVVAIEAQILDTSMGGVSTHLAALVKALGELDGPERYALVCPPENINWLRPYLGPNQTIVAGPGKPARQLVRRLFGSRWQQVWAKGYRIASGLARRAPVRTPRVVGMGAMLDMKGFYEKAGAKLVHVFPQLYVDTALPVIFNPHDLQHEHFPEFFEPQVLEQRRFVYRAACRSAAVIVAGSNYTREDVVRSYGVPAEKVVVIPLAPATVAHGAVAPENSQEVLARHAITAPFALYPAVTWEHKNHLRLLEAVVALRERGETINLVCTGRKLEPTWGKLERFIEQHGLEQQVKFLGFVDGKELRALYRSAMCVVAPSLFEQASGPMYEAWEEGVAIAASAVTSIPEQSAGGALLFDPYSVEEIAAALSRLWNDRELRETLIVRGKARLKDFTWERTAKSYRALYRRVGGWPVSDEDRQLLGLA